MKAGKDEPPLATNRAAWHGFHLLDRFEAGLVLTGTEVKSIRAGKANLKEGYAKIENGEVFLLGAHVSPYDAGSRENVDPLRARKLLLDRTVAVKILRPERACVDRKSTRLNSSHTIQSRMPYH